MGKCRVQIEELDDSMAEMQLNPSDWEALTHTGNDTSLSGSRIILPTEVVMPYKYLHEYQESAPPNFSTCLNA